MQANSPMNILLLSGSFHSRSRSLMLLRAVEALLPGHSCEAPHLPDLPYFCEDLNQDRPQVVLDFLAQVSRCDGIVFVSPEYNHSLPAVVKNAIDWASRPAFASPLKGKPVTFITQANSAVGGARAQAHFKLVLDATLSRLHPAHEMMVTGIGNVFDEKGGLADATLQRRLQRHLDDFLAFAEACRALPA